MARCRRGEQDAPRDDGPSRPESVPSRAITTYLIRPPSSESRRSVARDLTPLPRWLGRSLGVLGLYGSVVDAVLGYFATLGVSTAAGLNAHLPLLLLGILSRFTDLIELSAPWNRLEEPWALAVIGGVALLDFVGDKIAPIDHVLHAAGLAIAPATGAVAAAAAAGVVDVEPGRSPCWIGFVAATASSLTQAGPRPALYRPSRPAARGTRS